MRGRAARHSCRMMSTSFGEGLWSSSRDRSFDTHAGWLKIAFPMWLLEIDTQAVDKYMHNRTNLTRIIGIVFYLERSLSRLSTSCKASLPAAWFPQHSVALAKWLVNRLETCRARPECTASVEPPVMWRKKKSCTIRTVNHYFCNGRKIIIKWGVFTTSPRRGHFNETLI